MKAHLKSTRIAPKKANLIAKMIRGKSVPEALEVLESTNKNAARILERLLRSAMANAQNNDNQNPDELVIKSLIVNQAQAYHRGIPMARGRVRSIRKFLSHISLTLGVADSGGKEKKELKEKKEKKEKDSSQKVKNKVKQDSSKSKTDTEKGSSKKKTTSSPKVSAKSKKSSGSSDSSSSSVSS
ncbi:MAG: 50S ribosomal protein L22 [Candidatus Peribacteraceae bacterium]|jgi:large subunit ribosomal protein L22|nr:50S ribosomal protein L22 [Candidatus Peribacteraceae bacterium]MDP7454109.1 50S ribosomal protein L22 [Candidatus Peribacteraceae bacterium]MDP7645995.1 50S ribosomal protein L22 [Candidatus Peribacteraceae bacterium]|tara:strand:+ start:811 stop:1362 length:552 start_codon:yes stop_codon:yes gene_type:complete